MNIFFDTDYTWLGLDDSVRPGTREVMERLIQDGHKIYVWSGVGIRWRDLERHGLTELITDCFVKPLDNFIEAIDDLRLPVIPDIVLDDFPEVPSGLSGIWIRPYFYYNPTDTEMERIYQLISSCTGWRPGRTGGESR